jgi:sigma-E factor negative regulatory protein RseA
MNPEPRDPPGADGAAASGLQHQSLSSLADGDADALEAGCALWREDRLARERWHAYHVIGDVLRSDDLAPAPGRDAAFLAQLRSRLAQEPVPLAPVPTTQPPAVGVRGHRLGWRAPAAVAAGLMLVAGALVLTRGGFESGAPAETASLAAGSTARTPAAPATVATQAPRLVLSGGQLRDPDLDAYLRAHQAARGGAPAALPGGALRSVEMIVSPTSAAPRSPQAGGSAASGVAR